MGALPVAVAVILGVIFGMSLITVGVMALAIHVFMKAVS